MQPNLHPEYKFPPLIDTPIHLYIRSGFIKGFLRYSKKIRDLCFWVAIRKIYFLSSGPDRSMEYKKILEISIFW